MSRRLRTAGSLAAAVLLFCGASSQSGSAHKPVTWDKFQRALQERMMVSRQDQNRWTLAFSEEKTGENPIRQAAIETLKAAYDDLAWMVSEATYERLAFPGHTFHKGDKVKLPEGYLRAFFKDGAFTDPLRRYADAALRSHGMKCTNCLTGLRASRSVLWTQVSQYIKSFIYVESVSPSGQIDLRVGSYENGLPTFAYTDQDLAGAIYSLMQVLAKNEPDFKSLVEKAINTEVAQLGEIDVASAENLLNTKVPADVLALPKVRAMLSEKLPPILNRHGLRCDDCPGGSAH